MVILQQVSAGCSYSLKLVVFQPWHFPARDAEGVVEFVVGVIHLIDAEDCFQAAFVEGTVVGYEGQSFNQRPDLSPDLGEQWCSVSVTAAQTVNKAAPI